MREVYHRFREQKCSRVTHLELIWEIPADMIAVSLRIISEHSEIGLLGR